MENKNIVDAICKMALKDKYKNSVLQREVHSKIDKLTKQEIKNIFIALVEKECNGK